MLMFSLGYCWALPNVLPASLKAASEQTESDIKAVQAHHWWSFACPNRWLLPMAMACHGFPSWAGAAGQAEVTWHRSLGNSAELAKIWEIYIYIYILLIYLDNFCSPTCNSLCMELLRMVRMKVELAMPWAQWDLLSGSVRIVWTCLNATHLVLSPLVWLPARMGGPLTAIGSAEDQYCGFEFKGDFKDLRWWVPEVPEVPELCSCLFPGWCLVGPVRGWGFQLRTLT